MSKKEPGYIRPPGPDQKLTFFHIAVYLSLQMISIAVNLLPRFAARGLGGLLGRLFYRVDKRRHGIALRNLDQAFGGQRGEAEKRAIVRNCMVHLGRATVETLMLRQINERNFLKYVTFDNVGQFYTGLKDKKGVILCSAHYGNWEIMNLALGYMNLPMSVMARPMDNPLVHKLIEKIRTHSGNRVIYKHKSVRKLLSTLAENRIVGIVNDQDVHDRNRIFADFFGRPAATTPVPAALAYKTGAPIVTGYAVTTGKGRYLLKFGNLIHADQQAPKEAEIQRITHELNRRLEAQITWQPDYWMWIHKRFKTGPEGETDFYTRPRESARSESKE